MQANNAKLETFEAISLQDFIYSVSTAVQRAHTSLPSNPLDPKRPSDIIYGAIVYDPTTGSRPGLPGFPGADTAPNIPSFPTTLSRAGGAEISEESIARVNRRLKENPEASAALAINMLGEPARAMSELFELDAEQVEALKQDTCQNSAVPFMKAAAEAIYRSGMPFILDLKLTDESRAQEGKKKVCFQSFTINASGSVSGGASGVQGGGTVGGSITFGRCKK